MMSKRQLLVASVSQIMADQQQQTDKEKYPFPHDKVDFSKIQAAAKRIAPYAHVTPVMTCHHLDSLAGRELFFKCEIFQKVGAFKFRGACNAIMNLDEESSQKGVVTHSSGNHAQALALASSMRNVKCWVVMPNNAPQVKQQATKGYGANVVLCEPTLQAREDTANNIIKETGAVLIHPFNHPDIIAGQGTISIEILQQVPDLDAIIVPVGGGGMISGICVAAKAIKPSIRIFGAEPKGFLVCYCSNESGADDAYQSFTSGKFIPQTGPKTIADGLLSSMGSLTWPIIRDTVEQIITVTDDEIKTAMRLVWERMKLVIEPSAGVGVAVALSPAFKSVDGIKKVAIVLCGGNIDLDAWKW